MLFWEHQFCYQTDPDTNIKDRNCHKKLALLSNRPGYLYKRSKEMFKWEYRFYIVCFEIFKGENYAIFSFAT